MGQCVGDQNEHIAKYDITSFEGKLPQIMIELRGPSNIIVISDLIIVAY